MGTPQGGRWGRGGPAPCSCRSALVSLPRRRRLPSQMCSCMSPPPSMVLMGVWIVHLFGSPLPVLRLLVVRSGLPVSTSGGLFFQALRSQSWLGSRAPSGGPVA